MKIHKILIIPRSWCILCIVTLKWSFLSFKSRFWGFQFNKFIILFFIIFFQFLFNFFFFFNFLFQKFFLFPKRIFRIIFMFIKFCFYIIIFLCIIIKNIFKFYILLTLPLYCKHRRGHTNIFHIYKKFKFKKLRF